VMKKKGQKQQKTEKEPVEKDTQPNADADDEEVNSGFGSYLRSSTGKLSHFSFAFYKKVKTFPFSISGQEMLRMFVVVNSIVMFLTVAWPQMKSSYEIIREFIDEKFGSVDLL
jgi:hypothetical protein